MAGLHFPITADNTSFTRALSEVTASVRDASRQIEADGGNIDKVISKIKGGLATLGVGLGFKELSGQIFNTRAQFEQLEIAFTTMLGSAEKANSLLNQLKHTAAKTPFEMEDVVGGAKSLLAYGIEAEKVNDTLIRLGDIASGLSIPLNDLTWLYGTTMVQGRMFTQDFRQFQGRGIPIAEELSKVLGVAKEKVGDAVTAGKVGAKELEAAIKSMTDEGGRFGGLMAKQSDSLKGKWENIKDTIQLMFNEMGQQTSGVMNLTLDATASIVDHWQDVVAVLGTVATAYGAQKAYLMLDTAFTTAKNDYAYDSEIAQLKALIPVKEEAAKTDLRQAVASGKLTEERAKQIASLRDEANAQLEALAKKEAAARREEEIALAKEAAAKKNAEAIDEEINAVAEKLKAGMDSMSAEELETSVTQLNTLEELKNEAADAVHTAVEEAKAASMNVATAAQERETLATQINTAQTTGNTAATGILTIAKEKYALVQEKVNKVIAANKLSIYIGLVIALGYAIYKAATYQTDYEKAIKSADEAHAHQQDSMNKELNTLKDLKKQLESAKKGTEEWKSAKDQIVSQFGSLLPNLDSEIEKTGTLASTYDQLTRAIRLNAAAKAMAEYRENNKVEETNDALEVVFDNLSSGNITRIDKNGNPINDKKGHGEKVVVAGRLRDDIQEKLYKAIDAGGDLSEFSQQELAYLAQAGGAEQIGWEGGKRKYRLKGKAKEAAKKTRAYKAGEERAAGSFGFSVDEVDGRTTTPNKETKTHDKEYWESQKKDAEARLEALSDIAAAGKEGDKIKAEIAEYEKHLQPYSTKKNKKTGSGPTAAQIDSKQTDAHQKLLDLMRQQAEERLKLQQDYEYQQWQNRIDLMAEGEAKVLEQMRLDQSKERASLEEQKKQAIQAEIARQKAVFDARQDEIAAGNKKYAKQVFDPASIYDPEKKVIDPEIQKIIDMYDSLNADLLAKQQKAEADRLESAKESMNNYLKEFGNYQQKREAIATDYDTRIAEAASAGDRMMLEAQKNKALSDLDYQQWIDSEEIALAFGDISNLSRQTISRLIEDMEKYREKVVATFDPEKIEKYNEALNNLRMADVENAFSAFGDMIPEYFTKRLSIQKQINEQEQIGIELAEKRRDLEKRTQSQKQTVKAFAMLQGQDISDEDLADPKKVQQLADKVSQAGKSGFMFSEGLHAALVELLKLNGEGVKLDEATKSWDGNFSHLKEALANLDGDAKIQAIIESVGSAAGLVGDFANQASEMADALGAEGLGEALGYLGDAMGSVQNIASGFAKGGLVGSIAAAAGEVMNWVTKIAKAGDTRHQKNIERLQEKIEDLQKSYDKLGKAAENAYSTDASGIIEQQNALLEQQQALIRQQQAEEEAKKKSDKEKVKDYQQQLEENQELMEENRRKAKEAIIGKDIKGAIEDFASAYASAWEDGTDAAQASTKAVKSIISGALTESLKKDLQPAAQSFYDTLAKAMEDGILTDAELANLDTIKAQMDALAATGEEQYKKIQERYKTLDEIREELTDISFDSVSDNFRSLLSDMESTTEDFTDNFSDMLRNALINGLMDSKYNKLLEEWYAEFAEAMEDGELTDEERERLRQNYNNIVQQGIADKNAINDLVGGGAYSQQASSGSAWNMSQETGDELNGRFTAMVELEATNNTLVATGNSIAGSILATLQSMAAMSVTVTGSGDNETLLAIKDMMFLSTGHLENIAKYTKHLQTMSEDLTKMKEAVERI